MLGTGRGIAGAERAPLDLLDDHLLGAAVGKALPHRSLLDRALQRQRLRLVHGQSLFANVVRFTH
jgi:hypothetical protein